MMTSPTIYRSVEAVLAVLNNQIDNVQAVGTLLQVYNNALKQHKEQEDASTPNHAFIVLEGLDGCGKSTISKKLATTLDAAKCCTPPESIKPIRSLFDDHPQLRTAYYALGNYIAALECAIILKKQHVVMDRYWHSTSAYAISQAVQDFPGEIEIPPQGDNFYQWPEDLMKPDAVLFLDVCERTRIQRLSRRQEFTSQEELLKKSRQFRDNIILAYKNMVDPEVIFIDSNAFPNTVIKAIRPKIEHLLK